MDMPLAKGSDCGSLPGRVVLVLQGGGAMGAYQLGVCEALEEAGLHPDWVIGTSIGAVNGAILAGNPPAHRVDALRRFWSGLARRSSAMEDCLQWWPGGATAQARLQAAFFGIPGFFAPNPRLVTLDAHIAAERAAFYGTDGLRGTLRDLVDFERLNRGAPRFTVGAVGVRDGRMRYFDTRDGPISLDHVMASAALPPAFPAVRIGGELYWDGGIYSNTPVEAVFDDRRRETSVVFAVQLWRPDGDEPASIMQVMARQKEIRFASRAESHLARQAELHHLRHVIRALEQRLPAWDRADPAVRDLAAFGCATTMHLLRLVAPVHKGEDHMREIDFSRARLEERRAAGLEAARRMIARAPWREAIAPTIGVAIHGEEPDGTPAVPPGAGTPQPPALARAALMRKETAP